MVQMKVQRPIGAVVQSPIEGMHYGCTNTTGKSAEKIQSKIIAI